MKRIMTIEGAHDVRPLCSRRLLAIAARVPKGCAAVADVGADHGELSAHLLVSGLCDRVIVSDISPASLSKARRLFEGLGRQDDVRFAVSDGLSHLTPGEADVIIIAGMGSERIAGILAAGLTVAQGSPLILQPNVDAEPLRRFLAGNGFRITAEDLVHENRRFYPVIAAEAGEEDPHSPMEWSVGWIPLREKRPELLMLLHHRARVWEKALREAQAAGRPERAKGEDPRGGSPRVEAGADAGHTAGHIAGGNADDRAGDHTIGNNTARYNTDEYHTDGYHTAEYTAGDCADPNARDRAGDDAVLSAVHNADPASGHPADDTSARARVIRTELDRIREAIRTWTP